MFRILKKSLKTGIVTGQHPEAPEGASGADLSKHIALVGDCNQCGACCEIESCGMTLRCENLEVLGSIGQPRASRCRAYQTRYDGMPIQLYDIRSGRLMRNSVCAKNSRAETEAILSQGIGRGCSLSVTVALTGGAERDPAISL
jgi:hypothetical protein